MKIGFEWLVISDVSKQPPWSILTSIITDPSFIWETIFSETTHGVRLSFERKAPITTSALLSAFARTLGWIIDVKTRAFKSFWSRRNLDNELSKTLTEAPKPIADRAANSPTVPAPIITTSVGVTPAIPPNNNPLPWFTLLRHSEAIRIEVFPAISLIERINGIIPESSCINSYAKQLIFLSANFAINSFERVVIWSAEIKVWRPFIISISSIVGGSTFKMISAWYISLVSYTIFAPASLNSESGKLAPSPALVSIRTSCPWLTNSCTASGTIAILLSWKVISLGTPINKDLACFFSSSFSSWGIKSPLPKDEILVIQH